MIKHALKRSLHFAFVMVLANVASAAPEQQLTEADRRLILEFERVSGQSFAEFFADVVHQREYCYDRERSCYIPLQKRLIDYPVFVNGFAAMSENVKQAIRPVFTKTFDDLAANTGILPYPKSENDVESHMSILFVDDDAYHRSPEAYMTPRIKVPEFSHIESIEEYFVKFMEDDVPCIYIAPAYKTGEIIDAHIWIKTDIKVEVLAKCIAEELYNSLGIDEGISATSIFDWPFSNFDRRSGLSEFHLLLLRLLYRSDFKPGQDRAVTQIHISKILASER